MNLVQFIVIGLATWRIVNFVYDDRWGGPYDFLNKLRYAIGVRYDEKNRRAVVAKPRWRMELATMHNCPYCMSVWYGLLATVVWFITPPDYRDIWFVLATPFALSAVVSVMQKMVNR